MRSLAGMICRCGLLKRDSLVREVRRKRKRDVKRILDAYRNEKEIPRGASEERVRKDLGIDDLGLESVPIHFVGVWDTVDAVGLPFDELKVWADIVWRRLRKRRLGVFNDLKPHSGIRHACQALALDDERKTFHPLVWKVSKSGPQGEDDPTPLDPNKSDASRTAGDDGARSEDQTVRQVWFAGVHSNVGGGYPKDSLSLVPLPWMMCRPEDRTMIGSPDAHTVRYGPGMGC